MRRLAFSWLLAAVQLARTALALVAAALIVSPQAMALDAEWFAPVGGAFHDGTLWSTAPVAPTGVADRATIAASGSPYAVLMGQHTELDSITLNSADATLEVNNSTLTAPGGIQVDAGTLWVRGGALRNTRIAGAGTLQVTNNLSVGPRFENVELAKDLSTTGLTLAGTTTLDNATLNTRSAALVNNGRITGNGLWVVGPPGVGSSTTQWSVLLPSGGKFTVDPGVELATRGNQVNISGSAGATLINKGRIVSEYAGDRLTIPRLVNEGTLRVAGSGRMEVTFQNGNVGHVELAGGYLALAGDLFLNETITVPAGATLSVTDSANPLLGQAIQVQAGGVVAINNLQWTPRIESSGGAVLLDGQYSLLDFDQLPIEGTASLSLGYSGQLNLTGGVLNLDATDHELHLTGGEFRNGTLTSTSTTPRELGHTTLETVFRDLDLDVLAEVSRSRVWFFGASTISQPLSLTGGRLTLADQWSNLSGITVAGGILELRSSGAHFGSVDMTGGTFAIGYAATLAEVLAFDVGAPDVIEVAGSSTGSAGNLDLDGQTLDLESFGNAWRFSGVLRNGIVTGQLDGKPLAFGAYGEIRDAELNSVRIEGPGRFTRVQVADSIIAAGAKISFFGTSSNVFTDVTIDGVITCSGNTGDALALELRGHTVLNGAINGRTGEIRFAAGATLAGTGEIGNRTGRIQGITMTIVDDQFTIPAGLTLVSATQYDSTDRVVAPDTNLHIAGDMLVGYTSTFIGARTDSWTFDVASLETSGAVAVTRDGRLKASASQWIHRGEMMLTEGLVEADHLTIDAAGTIAGMGQIVVAEALDIEGRVAPGAAPGALIVSGDAAAAHSSVLAFDLAGVNPGVNHSQLVVTGALALDGGALEVNLRSGFAPATGSAFELITATGGIAGTFANLDFPSLAPGQFWNVAYTPTSVWLAVVAPDFTLDGAINGDDLAIWNGAFGTSALGDADGDTDTDGNDFLAWQRNVDSTSARVAQMAAPEPAALILLAAACVFGAITRRTAATLDSR
jgi:hypothetical protein